MCARGFALLLAVLSVPAWGDVRFTKPPTATRSAGAVKIAFTVSEPTDCAVAILDGSRRIVRHVAAGVLGDNASAPLRPGLAQRFVWDSRDDAGKPVAEPGKCTVRVSLGLRPAFDRILGWKGEAIGEAIAGLAADEKGEVYVLNSGGKKPTRIYVLDRQGKYLRMVLPYPASLPPEKVKAVGLIELTDGRRVPIMQQPICFALYPETYGSGGPGNFNLPQQTMTVVGGQLVLSNPWAGYAVAEVSCRRLLILNTDGSVPDNYLGPFLSNQHLTGFVRLASVRGQKAVYSTGLKDKAGKPMNVVQKVFLDETGPPKAAYLGQTGKAGNDEKHFNDPRGLAVDGLGNLYVSDWGNNRIVVFDAAAAFLGQVAVEKPGQLAVHPKTGAIYFMQEGKSAVFSRTLS